MTGLEFNSLVVQRLGFTLTAWKGAKPGDISSDKGTLIDGSTSPRLRCLRKATKDDWKAFCDVAYEIAGVRPTNFHPDTVCVEAAD
jgi:hypothetical protein